MSFEIIIILKELTLSKVIKIWFVKLTLFDQRGGLTHTQTIVDIIIFSTLRVR